MGQQDAILEKTSSSALSPGLYVLRYLQSDSADAPGVFVRTSPGNESAVAFITPPGVSSPILQGPGCALVIRVDRPSTILVTVRKQTSEGSLNAELRLEPLHRTNENAGMRAENDLRRPPEKQSVTLIGHVARQGDVRARQGEWIAGPDAPASIEGFVLEWFGSDGDLGIEYQVTTRGSNNWGRWVGPGTFVGSKGRHLALSGVRLRLTGSLASRYTLEGSALFLGSAVIKQRGQTVEFHTGSVHDPLVGLRLGVEAVASEPVVPPEAPSAERKSRVRVFRAGVEQRSS